MRVSALRHAQLLLVLEEDAGQEAESIRDRIAAVEDMKRRLLCPGVGAGHIGCNFYKKVS